MKKIATFKSTLPQGHVSIDMCNPELGLTNIDIDSPVFEDIIAQCLPYTQIFEEITLLNFYKVPATLISRLTNQYLHGANIRFITSKRDFDYSYKEKLATPFFSYYWKDLDLSKPIPRSLAEFRLTYQGKSMTYREAVSTLRSTRYLPNEIWVALDEYSQQRINKCREFNRGNYILAERWYKQLTKDAMASHIYIDSPNRKTYYEAMAEVSFEKACQEAQLKPGLRPLNEQELIFLQKYAPAYGVEIPTFKYRTATRLTEHGYTEEPERVYYSNSSSDWSRIAYDGRNASKGNGTPKLVRESYIIHEYESDKLIRDAYFQLMWLIKNLGDEALMPNWKRCPVCHKLYKESEGCECGFSEPVEFIPADNMLYGIASTYEDYGITGNYYSSSELE